jgi:ribosomal-protein-serine acetyltransferase
MLHLTVPGDIVLRTYSPEDATTLFHTIETNRAHLRRWLIWVDSTRLEAHSLSFILNAQQQQQEQRSLALGIFRQEQLIGGIGMQDWDHNLRKASIGFWLSKAAEGQGIIQQCAPVFIRFLFEKLDLNKVEIHYLPGNTRSAKAAQLLGFRTEGLLRDSFLMHGGYHDLVITGLLRRDLEGLD